jgi:hypothetical protein
MQEALGRLAGAGVTKPATCRWRLIEATTPACRGGGAGASRLCSVCFDGNYPIELPMRTALGNDVIQRTLANAARTCANPASVMQSENDNVPALRRPERLWSAVSISLR